MSEITGESTSADSSAEEIRRLAAVWLERRVDAAWTAEDQAALEAWLAKSSTHRIAYLRVETAWRRTYRLAALRSPAPEIIRQRVMNIVMRVAAALAAIILVVLAVSTFLSRPHERTYATGIGGHTTVTLADGSRVELNTDTVLRTSVTATRRIVWLDKGEAYFEIAHSATRPFSVVAGDHRLIDLGTKFLVRRSPSRFEVALVEGLVRFERTSGETQTQSVLLRPGDVAVAAADTLIVAKKSAEALAGELGWRQGLLIFDHTALADVANEFNRYNREKLIVADSVAARREVFGTFQANNVASFARAARVAFGYRVEERGDEIVISR